MSKNFGYNTLEIDQREFGFDAEEFIAKMAETPTTLTLVDRALGARGVGVTVTDGREKDGDPKIIAPRAYQGFSEDPFEQQRDKALAVGMKALVIGVDTPGVGLGRIRSRSTFGQKLGAWRGDASSIADSQLFAVRKATGLDYEEPARLLTYSMPNWFLSGYINSSFAPNIERFDAVELVNDQSWNLIGEDGLPKAMAAEDKFTDYYLEQNSHYPGLLQPYDRDPANFRNKARGKRLPFRLQSLMLGKGMTKPFAYDLVDAIKSSEARGEVPSVRDAQVHIWRGEDSGAARHSANRQTVEQLRRVHPNVELTIIKDASGAPMHHPFWHSVPSVAILASAMAEAAR